MDAKMRLKMGFSVPTGNAPGRAPSGMKKLVYKPEYDDPALARAAAKKKRAAAKRKADKKKAG